MTPEYGIPSFALGAVSGLRRNVSSRSVRCGIEVAVGYQPVFAWRIVSANGLVVEVHQTGKELCGNLFERTTVNVTGTVWQVLDCGLDEMAGDDQESSVGLRKDTDVHGRVQITDVHLMFRGM
jgi:hypothetical protein